MKDFHKIQVWDKSHKLTIRIYKVTESFPRDEVFGLTSQIRRAAVSIPTNIAEGCGRNTDTEFARFMEIASGSASELDYLLMLVRDLGLIDEARYTELSVDITEIRKMLTTFIKTVRNNVNRQKL
jgi:four helix bundle protein